ncbi:MAG: cell division protein SepF [Clostridia bacterium]|nr:cell division protein SepF [Clostridia bacterium]
MADRWDYFDKNDRNESSRSRLFEGLNDENPRSSRDRGEDPFSSRRQNSDYQRDFDEYRAPRQTEDKRPSYGDEYGGLGNVTICAPKSYKDVQEMIEKLARKESVIVNLEGVDGASAQRVLDFLSGASFALGGSMRRIKEFTFLITPAGTGITDSGDGYFNR